MKIFLLLISLFFASPVYASYIETFRAQYRTASEALAAAKTYSGYHHEGPLAAGYYSGGLFSNYTFYVSYALVNSNWNYGVYEIPCPNAASYESQCGGSEYYTFNLSSCTGSCIACYQQKKSKVTECGGLDKVQCDDQCNCSCQSSDPCATQRAQADSECGEFYIFNDQTCQYTCNGQSLCLQEKQAKASQCGGSDHVSCDQNCDCVCKSSCSDQRAKAVQECGGNDKYYMDDASCVYWCRAAACPDADADGVADVCDQCLNNPDISSLLVETYKYSDGKVCLVRTKQCDGSYSAAVPQGCTYSSGAVDATCKVDADCNAVRDGGGGGSGTGGSAGGGTGGGSGGTGGGSTGGTADDLNGNGVPDSKECDLNAAASRAAHECGDIEFVVWDSFETCRYHCNQCTSQYQAALKTCTYPIPDRTTTDSCDYVCNCNSMNSFAERRCPMGYTLSADCTITCIPCDILKKQCSESCPSGATSNYCHAGENGIPDDKLCTCKQSGDSQGDTADGFDASCEAACAQSGCNGVKYKDFATKKCECNSCGNKYIGTNNGTGDTSSNPSDSSDTNGWLKSIKENTDNLVRHAEDAENWYSSFNKNIEKSTEVNSKGFSTVNATLQGIDNGINGQDGVKSRLGGVNARLDGVNDNLGDIKEGLSNVSIGTEAGSLGELETGDYGDPPGDKDLPTKQDFKNAFDRIGTFDPGESNSGYRGQVKTTLEKLKVTTDDPICSTEISLPWVDFHARDIIWNKFPINFCPYQSYFALIGNVLVVCFGLRELYMFSS